MRRTPLIIAALCFFTLALAVTLGVTLPDDDGNIQNFTDFAGGTTDLWDEINEDPDSSPVDSDGIEAPDDTTEGAFFLMAAMPGDFVTMISLDLEVRCAMRDATSGDADTYQVRVRAFRDDESTPLSDSPSAQAVPFDTTFRNYTFTLTGVVAGSKAIWDAARLFPEQVYSQFKGPDADAIQCSALKMSGVYSNVAPTRSRVISIQ